MSIRIGLLGFGRTGSVVAKEIASDSALSLEWVCRKSTDESLEYASQALGFKGDFAPFVSFEKLSLDFLRRNPVDIVVDFSTNAACRSYEMLASTGVRIVSAISKYTDDDLRLLKNASRRTAVLHSPNITLGINWLMIASKLLKQIVPHADIEVVEEHFRDKREVSGTALKIAGSLGLEPDRHVNSIRVGGVIGKHEVIFGLPNQTIRLTHESISRAAFGTGAIFAGKWLHGKEPGFYSMEQMFHEKFVRKLSELKF